MYHNGGESSGGAVDPRQVSSDVARCLEMSSMYGHILELPGPSEYIGERTRTFLSSQKAIDIPIAKPPNRAFSRAIAHSTMSLIPFALDPFFGDDFFHPLRSSRALTTSGPQLARGVAIDVSEVRSCAG